VAAVTYLEAIRQGIWEEMERDSSVFVLGEDVGIYGGAFKLTEGMLERFGEDRVVDTPISESAIVGAAIGAALMGMRPIAEMQFADFISCAFDQITNFAAKCRYRWSAGVPMVSIVRAGSGRVDANFKETDLGDMRPGQPAEVRIDAYHGLVLKGHVESIGSGTGSEFSILPAQNATGNWVKVIQRVPVRIAIDSKSDRPLIAGLSAVVKVDVSKH